MLPLIAAFVLAAVPASAHEFWISPQTYIIGAQDQLVADIRVGEDFKGGASAFLPSRFRRFDIVMDGTVYAVDGRIGDRPALAIDAPTDGLATVVHVTTDSLLTYREAVKFANFVNHKDFAWAIAEHAARGLPEAGFRERYSRYGKSLIAVGEGAGADQEVGILTEIVALANPYTDDLSGGFPVKVLYEGEIRPDTQIELFEKAPDGTVNITLHRTDAAGLATLPVKAGHEYLVDSVVMRAVEPVIVNDPVWESLWASLTFMVPAQ